MAMKVAEKLEVLGPFRPSWSGILAGAFVGVGLMYLLHLLGLAIGLTAVDQAPRGAFVWIAVWALIVPIVSLFVGGVIAGRFSGAVNRIGGALHGVVTWAFGTLVAMIVAGVALTSFLGGVMSLGGTVASAAGAAVSSLGGGAGQLAQAAGLDVRTVLEPINQSRAQRGLPPLTESQLQAAFQDAVQTSIRQGRIDRDILVDSLAANTAVSRQEANNLVDRAFGQVGMIGQQVAGAAGQALDVAAAYLWFGFLSALLALGATALGGALGVSRSQREEIRRERAERPVITPPREVYP